MEAKHSPPGRGAQSGDPNGSNRSLRDPPNHSLCSTRNLLPTTSQNHEPSLNQILPNTGRFNVRLHHRRDALHNRLVRPRPRQIRPEIHRPRERHHFPHANGDRVRDLDPRDARRRIRGDQAKTGRDRARAPG